MNKLFNFVSNLGYGFGIQNPYTTTLSFFYFELDKKIIYETNEWSYYSMKSTDIMRPIY